jgi:sulfur-oxidizing protein SoxY
MEKDMNITRRRVLGTAGSTGLVAVAVAAGLVRPASAQATKATYEAKTTADAMKTMGVASAADSKDIQIKAPDIAENGAVVPIEVVSNIAGTESIAVFVEKNPFPFVGSFDVSKGALPFVALRTKVGESSNVRVVVAAGGKYYQAVKEVKVTIGGCGG